MFNSCVIAKENASTLRLCVHFSTVLFEKERNCLAQRKKVATFAADISNHRRRTGIIPLETNYRFIEVKYFYRKWY
jgi:hypothetical protein